MAQIKYLDSRRIMGASTDTVETLTFEDDFTSDNFNDTGTKIGVANNTLEWDGTQNGSVHGSTIDLTSINTKALFRAKLRINTLTAPSSASNFILIGFSDSDHTIAGDSTQDGIGLIIQNDTGTNSFRAMHVDGAPFSPNAGTAFATVPATATDYFIEVVLDVNTWYVRIYSDSSYSALIEEETGSITATGLRYFGIKMRSSVNVNGTFNGYIDDFKFYNGVSSLTSKPKPALSLSGCKAYYNFEQTSGSGSVYNTQFNDSSGWTSSGSDVTISGGLAQYVISSGTSTSRIYRSQSITATFEANFDFIINSESRSDSSSQLLFTLSDSIYVGSGLGDTTGSYIGFGVLYEASPARSTWIKSRYNNTDDASDSGTYNFSTATQYFAKVKRTSPTSVNYSVYGSDSDRTSETNSLTSRTMTISSNIPDLDYIIIGGRATGSGASDIDIDNIEVWNTTVNLTNIATTGNGFADGLGSSADGTNNGATISATGKVGSYAWDFDGSNDYVNVSGITLPAYNSTDTFSVSAWINMDTLATSPTQYQRLFHWYDGTKQWQLYIFSSGEIGFNNTQANQGVDTSSSVISTGTWYHLVVVKTGNNTYKIYLNGVDQSTTSTGGGNPSPSTQTFRIGASITGSGSDGHFNGRIDEFSVFTRALTSSEVSALYNSGTGVAVNDSSLQVKPETNSIFVETDTANRWWFNGTNWNMQPTYQTDFSSSTGWTTVGSNITITGGVIQASSMVTQSNNRIYYDLGLELSDKFVVDFDHYANTASVGGFWQMFALTDTTSIPRTDDSIHVLIDMGNWISYLRYSNEGSETNVGSLGNLTTGQWQYVRFVRNGTTGTLTVYSDSDRTTQVLNVSGTIPATVTGLRYFQSGALSGANAGTTTYKIDNLKIYNGVTSVQQ